MRLRSTTTLALLAALSLPACGDAANHDAATNTGAEKEKAASADNADLRTAVFAGGCFWCMEQAFEEIDGVVGVTSGYTGGDVPNPSYEQVSHGVSGHVEAVRVRFDPGQVSYKTLLQNFWHNVDPTDARGQFCDHGSSYRSTIFAQNKQQRRLALASRKKLEADPDAPSPIVTKIRDKTPFYPAEDYHQDYYKKNPLRYHYYKYACGRVQRLEELWGKQAGKP